MTPEEQLRQRFLASRGLTLDGTPIPALPPAPVEGTGLPGSAPYRTPTPGAVDAWRNGTPAISFTQPSIPLTDPVTPSAAASAVPVAAAVPPPVRAFPVGGADAVPNTRPLIDQGPQGLTLNSTPAAQGWEGTVGVPAAAPEKPAYDKKDLMAGLEEVAKGLHPKIADVGSAATITPMSVQPNNPNSLAYDLMGSLNKRRGLSLTGRM